MGRGAQSSNTFSRAFNFLIIIHIESSGAFVGGKLYFRVAVADLAGKLGMQPATQRFVEHLAETGRIRYIKDVYEAFQEILAERTNRAMAKLTTAAAVNAADLADIKKKLEALTGKQVDVDAKVDATLIGGAKAQIGSTVYDGTIKNQLNKMRNQLMN